ncbi:TorF family putative porin [Hyphococcus sp.]|uniref:TorF family putative porin n=1 Tax=Hyphococcus sp. TaxID=2038636 RepID=UPI003CCBF999
MYRALSSAIAIAVMSVPASAETLGVSTDVAFESRYVFRGVQLQEASVQPAITLSFGNFYAGAWFALPVGDDDGPPLQPYGDELDLFAGYSAPLSEVVTFDAGVTYYTYPDAASGFFDGSTNTWEAYGGLSFDIPLSPSVYVYRDFTLDATTVEGGVSYSFPLAEKTSFDLGGSLGYVIADNGGTDYLYGAATADISYAFSDNGSFYVGARFGGSDLPGGSIIDNSVLGTYDSSGFWWGVGFSASF